METLESALLLLTEHVHTVAQTEQLPLGAALGRAALSKSRKVFYTVGFGYQLVIFLMRLLPSTAANAILGKMYAE